MGDNDEWEAHDLPYLLDESQGTYILSNFQSLYVDDW